MQYGHTDFIYKNFNELVQKKQQQQQPEHKHSQSLKQYTYFEYTLAKLKPANL